MNLQCEDCELGGHELGGNIVVFLQETVPKPDLTSLIHLLLSSFVYFTIFRSNNQYEKLFCLVVVNANVFFHQRHTFAK